MSELRGFEQIFRAASRKHLRHAPSRAIPRWTGRDIEGRVTTLLGDWGVEPQMSHSGRSLSMALSYRKVVRYEVEGDEGGIGQW